MSVLAGRLRPDEASDGQGGEETGAGATQDGGAGAGARGADEEGARGGGEEEGGAEVRVASVEPPSAMRFVRRATVYLVRIDE